MNKPKTAKVKPPTLKRLLDLALFTCRLAASAKRKKFDKRWNEKIYNCFLREAGKAKDTVMLISTHLPASERLGIVRRFQDLRQKLQFALLKSLRDKTATFYEYELLLEKQKDLIGELTALSQNIQDERLDVVRKVLAKAEADLASTKQKNEQAILHLIAQGEGHTIEFKETLEYDVKTNKNNKDVLLSSLKTIAGFLNANGGTMLLGVHDSGEIRGIERDLSTMKHSNNDRFEQKIRNCLKDRFNPQPIGKVNISFEKFTEGTICRVDVIANKEVVHLDGDVYVRDGNTTRKLEGPDLTHWIQQRVGTRV
jgi:predicted HTH transcriptional regulator